ncbi:MAG: mandelate racemase/muconate lactonizing enzyme family protein [Rhodospirillales bacterium]|nr:mandelate racemase/muconate lactonizing enzyme family protein [Rhodospirillales bacterium]MDE0379233.1 mandelate racemase/muconate lactonizing enzyme family protein [Rhodospirillales bacterium]
MPKIETLEIDLFRLPLPVAMGAAAAGVMTAFDLVTARITDSDGASGVGYTVMHEGQGGPIAALCDGTFRASVEGRDPDLIETIWREIYRRHHYAGRGGPVGFALAAVDVALWDLKGNRLGTPLWRLLGGADPSVRAYAGNIDLNFPVDELLAGGMASVEQGFRSVKMRLGRPTIAEDIARVDAMRTRLPDEIELMADANEAWRVDEAARAMTQLEPFDLVWLEEPIAPDNTAGYAHLRSLGKVPLAAGENHHTLAEFAALIGAGGVDFPEPDLTTCGGITPFMKIAHLAEAHGLPVMSHGAHDLHIHLLAAAPNAAYLEWHAFGLERFMEDPLTVADGYARAPDRPGHGIALDWQALAAHRPG